MLIIKSLLLASYFLTQVAVLAAPVPLNAPLNDDALFSRAGKPSGADASGPGKKANKPKKRPAEGEQVCLEYVTWNLQ